LISSHLMYTYTMSLDTGDKFLAHLHGLPRLDLGLVRGPRGNVVMVNRSYPPPPRCKGISVCPCRRRGDLFTRMFRCRHIRVCACTLTGGDLFFIA
jgi:hypothetical protein